jgi:DNA-binding transcriptional regulator YhcF (GntR family)
MGLVIRLTLVVRTTGIFITAQHTSDEAKFEPRYSTKFVSKLRRIVTRRRAIGFVDSEWSRLTSRAVKCEALPA